MESNKTEINYPFSIVYDKNSYIAYSGDKEYSTSEKLVTNGRKPISGKISIYLNDYITVTNLKLENFICNKPYNGNLICERSS